MSACAAALLVTLVVDLGVNRAVQEAEAHLRTVNRTYPAARVTFEVEGLVPPVSGYVAQLTDLDPERPPQAGDAALGEAAQRLAAVARMSPYMAFGYRPAEPTVLGALGHMFMHVDIFHLLGNMLFLWLAGGVLECFWRRWAYLLLFVGAGLGGLLAFHLSAPGSTIPLVGASGAVFGLLGAFVVGYPRTRIRIFYFLWAFRPFVGTWLAPALVVFPLWALVEVFYAMVGVSSGVAHWAHVGGFLVGVMAAVVARQLRLVAVDDGRIGPEASAASLAPSLPLPTLDPSVAPGVMPAHPSGAPARASGPPAAYPSVPTYSARPSASAPAYGIGPTHPSVPAYGVAPTHPSVPAYGAAPTHPSVPAYGAAPSRPPAHPRPARSSAPPAGLRRPAPAPYPTHASQPAYPRTSYPAVSGGGPSPLAHRPTPTPATQSYPRIKASPARSDAPEPPAVDLPPLADPPSRPTQPSGIRPQPPGVPRTSLVTPPRPTPTPRSPRMSSAAATPTPRSPRMSPAAPPPPPRSPRMSPATPMPPVPPSSVVPAPDERRRRESRRVFAIPRDDPPARPSGYDLDLELEGDD